MDEPGIVHDQEDDEREISGLAELKLHIHQDLYRAFQRCVWIQIHETGRDQLDIMHEVVQDFLVKHGC